MRPGFPPFFCLLGCRCRGPKVREKAYFRREEVAHTTTLFLPQGQIVKSEPLQRYFCDLQHDYNTTCLEPLFLSLSFFASLSRHSDKGTVLLIGRSNGACVNTCSEFFSDPTRTKQFAAFNSDSRPEKWQDQ